jgi:hypothetical protein
MTQNGLGLQGRSLLRPYEDSRPIDFPILCHLCLLWPIVLSACLHLLRLGLSALRFVNGIECIEPCFV